MEAPAIGIDLGTTYSCVAVFQNEKSHIIEINNESRTMASVISFTRNGRIVGDTAKENIAIDPTSTIYGVKRFMGYTYNEIIAKNMLHSYPVDVINQDNYPKFQVELKGDSKNFSPEEISAAILERLKKCAEDYLKMEVKNAVITVPAHFNDAQRTATRNAGRIAGLEVLRIINEPTAAALAYGLDKKYANQNGKCNVLVYDFGGGTFDVSIINIDDGVFEVKSTDGDTHLGGDDIDDLLVAYFVEEIQNRHGTNIQSRRRTLRRLRLQCEKLKKTLSTTEQASIEIDGLEVNLDFCSSMNRSLFETMCIPIIKKTIDLMENALKEAKMNIKDIDEVILVGGTTRIPKVREMVKEFFAGKQLNLSLNPDEAIAIGASVQAAVLDQSNTSEIIGGIVLLDVNSLSLGIKVVGGVMSVLIPRNTAIPVETTKQYSTAYDNQTSVSIIVYEGERRQVAENSLLGSFSLTNLTQARRGKIKIIVTFSINTDGILSVTAIESSKKNRKSIDILMDKHRPDEEEIQRMISEAQKYRRDDAKWEAKVQAKIQLEHYCTDLIHRVTEEFRSVILKEHKQIVLSKCNEILKLLDKDEDQPKEFYEQTQKEVHNVCHAIIKVYL